MNLHNRWWNSSRRLRDARGMSPVASQRLRKARKNNPPMVHDLYSYFCLFCFPAPRNYIAPAAAYFGSSELPLELTTTHLDI